MPRNEMPDWAVAAFLFIILATLFPVAAQRIFSSVVNGIFIGIISAIIIAAIIIGIWWYLENN